MVTEDIPNISMTESELHFNNLIPTGKTKKYVLLSDQHYNNDSDQDNLNNN